MTINHFELLGLEFSYKLKLPELKRKYLAAQALSHPDRANSEQEKRQLLERSMQLNEAEKILKDDYLRAEYMLKLSGVEFNDQNLKKALSPEQLEEFVEINELLEDLDDIEQIHALKLEKEREVEAITQDLENCFDNNNMAKALDLTLRLKYLTNLVKNIKRKAKYGNS